MRLGSHDFVRGRLALLRPILAVVVLAVALAAVAGPFEEGAAA